MIRQHSKTDNGLPSSFARLDYIEGTGTQYIDTGVSARSGFMTTVYLEFRSNKKGQCILGSHNTRSPYQRNCISTSSATLGAWELDVGDSFLRGGSFSIGVDYKVDGSTIKGDGYIRVNDVTILSTVNSQDRYAGNLMFFTNQYGKTYSPTDMAQYRLKECYIYDSRLNLIRHYVPALRISDSKPGIYDFCNSSFYVNVGTGEFQYAYRS